MINLKKSENKLKKLEEERKELFKLLKPLQNKLKQNFHEIEKTKNEIALILLKSNEIDWNLLLDINSGSLVYQRLQEELRKRRLFSNGYSFETNQYHIRICLTKNKQESLNQTILSLNEKLPFLKVTNSGFKFIGIFEKTLSHNGVYYLMINEKEKIYKIMCDVSQLIFL